MFLRIRRGWKVPGIIVLVCMIAALAFAFFRSVSGSELLGMVLFGDPDPYISQKREKELTNEINIMVEKQFGVSKSKRK